MKLSSLLPRLTFPPFIGASATMYTVTALLLSLYVLRTTAQIPTLPPDPNINTPTDNHGSRSACYNVIDYSIACGSLTPSFSDLDPTAKASCYCYDTSGSYVPSIFNAQASSCWNGWIKPNQTIDVSWYSSNFVGACTRFASAASVTVWSSFTVPQAQV